MIILYGIQIYQKDLRNIFHHLIKINEMIRQKKTKNKIILLILERVVVTVVVEVESKYFYKLNLQRFDYLY